MKNKGGILLFIAVVLWVLGAAGSPFYVVNEYEQSIVTQFGEPIGTANRSAGLYMKVPFIQKVTYFDKRILEWDGYPTQIPTKDKKYIWVDSMARWKITDPLLFYRTVFDVRGARGRLDDVIDATVRDVITSYDLLELVRDSNGMLDRMAAYTATGEEDDLGGTGAAGSESMKDKVTTGREALRAEIYERARKIVPQYGIELVDVRIKHVTYVDEVKKKVYERMVAERMRAAEMLRSRGRGKSAEIEGQTQKELQKILSEARRDAELIKGKADQEATDIYAQAYSSDIEFFTFMRSLDAYDTSITPASTLILSTDSEYFSDFGVKK